MDLSLLITVLFALLVILLVGVILVSLQQNKKRRQALESFALERGFTFTTDDTAIAASLQNRASFDLFQHGHSHKYKNLLHGSRSGTEIHIFDYRYTTGAGKSSHTENQTALLLNLPGEALPKFFLRPEGLFDKVAAKLGHADINFDHRAEFSKKYRLTGADESQLRALFDDNVLAFFEENLNLCVESSGTQILYYNRAKQIKPAELPARLDNALKLVSLLSRRSPARS